MRYLSVALTAGGLLAVAYRLGRCHAAWHEVGAAKQGLRANRRVAWLHTVRLALAVALLLLALLATGFSLSESTLSGFALSGFALSGFALSG
jgi:hypothetical protein